MPLTSDHMFLILVPTHLAAQSVRPLTACVLSKFVLGSTCRLLLTACMLPLVVDSGNSKGFGFKMKYSRLKDYN